MIRVGDNRPMALSFLYLMARWLVGILLGRHRSEQAKLARSIARIPEKIDA